jgi:hypothetical protein
VNAVFCSAQRLNGYKVTLPNKFVNLRSNQVDDRYQLFKDHERNENEFKDCIFAHDDRLEYKAFDKKTGKVRSVTDGNYCRLLFELDHDLRVAENKSDFGATEKIAKHILDLLNGNYTPANGGPALVVVERPTDNHALLEEYNKLRLFTNLMIIHAAQAIYRVEIQKKATELMRNKIGPRDNRAIKDSQKRKDEKKRLIGKDNYERLAKAQNSVGLDSPVNQYLMDITGPANGQKRNELLLNLESIFANSQPGIKEKCKFAVLLMNPIHIQEITTLAIKKLDLDETFSREKPISNNEVENTFKNAITTYIKNTFILDENNGLHMDLKNVMQEYFIRCFDLANTIAKLNKTSRMPNMKLVDSNGLDIFGNSNTCTFNAMFNSFEKNTGNRHLVTVGGVLTKEQLKDLYTETTSWTTQETRGNQTFSVTRHSTVGTTVPFREYIFDGRNKKWVLKKYRNNDLNPFYEDEACL